MKALAIIDLGGLQYGVGDRRCFVVGTRCNRFVPRRVDPGAPRVVLRTARVGLRLTSGQRRRCFGLLTAAGDVWACVLDMNRWRRQRGLPAVVSYQAL